MNYLLELRDTVDKYKLEGKNSFTVEEYEKAKSKYLELLNNQDKEYLEKADKDKVQYYQNVKALKKTTRICR